MGALRIRLNFLLGMDWGNPMKCHSTRSFCRYFLGKDWDPIFRDNFCQQFPNVLSVVDGVAELPKLILRDFVVEGLILPNVDQVVFGLPYFLVGQQKFLKELLARAQTGVDNGNVHVRLKAGQADHAPRQIVNPDRISHIQDENFAAFGIDAGLEHQGDCLGDGHKVPNDLGIGDGNGTAGSNLLFE